MAERPTPEAVFKRLIEHRPTVFYGVPTLYASLLAHPELPAADSLCLRRCTSAGEALPREIGERFTAKFGCEIIDGIGSTELLHIFISHTEDDARPGATGKAIPGYRACVLDDTGQPLPPGQVGRLAVRGPTGCRYLADPRQATYVVDGWNLTGDAYLQDEDGYFHYQARTDDMIISAGYNIAGPEVEAALMLHPSVAECAVVGWPDDERGKIVKAFVVLRPEVDASEAHVAALQAFVKASIAPYKYPRAVEFVSELPRTDTGKLRRSVLRERAATPAAF
jgi:2-aminobenzoate-CoA ligase